ncbi:MAG: hypothetical protein HYS89_00745 [Candidatus Colwellbacteria bacterium]|nr:hypothetical protein [Candidatus Colwellbacteria bacterium]
MPRNKKAEKPKSSFQFLATESESTGDITPLEKRVSPIEIRVGQLEVKLEALEERLKGERALKLWVIGTVLAIVAGIFGALTIYINLTKDSQDSYRELQNNYYEKLLELRKDILSEKNASSQPPQSAK